MIGLIEWLLLFNFVRGNWIAHTYSGEFEILEETRKKWDMKFVKEGNCGETRWKEMKFEKKGRKKAVAKLGREEKSERQDE